MASAASKGVFVLENCQISPPKGTVPNTSLSLTFFDLPWIHFPPLHALIFYDAPYSRSHFTKTVVPNLKTSLSLALKHFFPLAGNLILIPSSTTSKPEIRYVDGDSVSLTFAESTKDNIFGYLTGRSPRYVVEFDPFVPQLPPPTNEADRVVSPLFAIQITLFPNNGICFGMAWDHVVGDGSTMDGFRRAWALINTKLVLESLALPVMTAGGRGSVLPFYDRTVIKDPKGLYEILLSQLGNINEPQAFQTSHLLPTQTKMVRASFVMARSDIERLKKLVKEEGTKVVHVSSFVVVCAYVWSCQAKSRAPLGDLEIIMHEDDGEIEHFGCSVDCRPRLDPRVPSTYFGNCITVCSATTKSKRLKGPWPRGFLTGAELIGEAINEILNNEEEEDGVLKGMETLISDIKAMDGQRILGVAGSPKFSFHDIDFGWGKPRKFEASYNTGSMSLNGSKDFEGGLEIGLSLPEDIMEVFVSIFARGLEDLKDC